MTKFEVLSWHWLKRQGKPRNNLSHDNHSVGQDLNAELSKYEAGALSDSVQYSTGLMLQKCMHPATWVMKQRLKKHVSI
jgi:hypothetical protein